MTIRRILLSMTAALALTFVPSCTKEGRDASGGIVQKEVGISMADGLTTRTVLYQYDTSAVRHPVAWAAGDRMWCYSEAGIYMDYTLKAADILSGEYVGQYAKTHIVFRYGDEWVVCYFKGSAIGDYTGARKKDRIVLENGIPREQSGRFGNSHICIVRSHPDAAELVFENAQAFVRFEVTDAGGAGVRDGKIFGNYVSKITVQSLGGEKMAGNLEIKDINGWGATLQDSGDEADRTISVIPEGGYFVPSPSDADLSNYFVAVPARYYTEGIRFILFTREGGTEAARGYVDVPGVAITSKQILNCHDLLKYCAFYVTGISLGYGDIEDVTLGALPSGIQIMEGHTGTLIPVITPVSATDKSLRWESSDPGIVSVNQNGEITAASGAAGQDCNISVYARDRAASEAATASVKVTVTPDPTIDHGGDGSGYNQEEQTNWD